MKDLFSMKVMVVVDHRCFGCDRLWPDCSENSANRKIFKSMTGRKFPGPVSFNASRDFQSLGLEYVGPERIDFCLDCSVTYMQAFNRLNADRFNRLQVSKQEKSS